MDAEYVRMVSLERENQALRDQIRDLQSLLQVKDSEISLKYHLLQAKERENSHARSRLQWLEAAIKQAVEAEALRIANSTFDRGQLLRYKAGLELLGQNERPAELGNYETRAADGGAEDRQPKTPSSGKKAKEEGGLGLSPASPLSEQAPAPTTPSSKGRGRGRGGEALVWQRKKPNKDSTDGVAAEASDEASPASTSKSSPGRRAPPAALELPGEESEMSPPSSMAAPAIEVQPPVASPTAAASDVARGDSAGQSQSVAATPNKRMPILDPNSGRRIEELQQPSSTPSKRLAIVDPNSGKHIEITPSSETSRLKPTLISLEARAPLPLSPAGPSAPPLTLPPVVAGAPPLATQPLRSPAPGPFPGGLVPSAPMPPIPPYAAPPAGPGWLPGPLPSPSGARPAFPPPAHPAPAVDAPGLQQVDAAASLGLQPSSSEPPSAALQSSPEQGIAERLADALGGGGGGLVQMARGPLAAGDRPSAPLSSADLPSGTPCGVVGRPTEPPPPPPAGAAGGAATGAGTGPGPIGPAPSPGHAAVPPASAAQASAQLQPPGPGATAPGAAATPSPQLAPGLAPAANGSILPAPLELSPPPPGFGPPPVGPPPPAPPPGPAPAVGAPPGQGASGLLGLAGYRASPPPPPHEAPGNPAPGLGGDGDVAASVSSLLHPQPPQTPVPPPPLPTGAAPATPEIAAAAAAAP